jgi:A/G-specific adenine glycosylase
MNFSNLLIDWYLKNKRDLPWRQLKNPYAIWLSEIILQQTRVAQGWAYYEKFLDQFPTVFDLAAASEQDVIKCWQGLGYYSRARNLYKAAQIVVKDYHGNMPNTYDELLQLPGIGDYTASAIASICFGEKTPVVDGNVYRFLGRYFGIQTPINSSKGVKEYKELAFELIDSKDPATFNQAIMEFGALQCKPQNPNCFSCPFQSKCEAYAKNTIKSLPVKINKTKIKKRYFNYLVFVGNVSNTLLVQRTGKGIWQNLYEFPLLESNSLIGEEALKEHANFPKWALNSLAEISLYNDAPIIHKLSHQHLITQFWIVAALDLPDNSIAIEKLEKYPISALTARFLKDFHF